MLPGFAVATRLAEEATSVVARSRRAAVRGDGEAARGRSSDAAS